MSRLGRLAAVVSVLIGASMLAPAPAWAPHCPPEHYPHPPGVPDNYPCPEDSTPRPTVQPTPQPTPAPTAAPTAAPTRRPTATRRPTTGTGTSTSTPAPTTTSSIDVEVPTSEPQLTPEIIVDGPVTDEQPLDVAEPSASASSWIFGFIVGLIIGLFAGRASWGLRKRRRQQIFG